MERFGRLSVARPPEALVWSLVAVFLIGVGFGLALDARMMVESGLAPGSAARLPEARSAVPTVLVLLAVAGAAALVRAALARGAARKEAREAEFARVHSRLDLALEASQVGFWDVDLDTGELSWDDRVCHLFGVPQRKGFHSEADWVAALHPDDCARAVAAAEEAATLGERFVQDYRVVWPDGQVRHVRDMAAFREDTDGARRLTGLVWDITADKAREAELEARRREAEAADVAKSNFLAAMSHEIRTPLAAVIGMLDLIAAEPTSARQAERLRIAGVSARGLLRILNDVLDLSRLQAEAVALRPERVRVRDVIHGVTDLMAARAEQKGLSLTCRLAEGMPEWIEVDAVRVRQVLTNIVSNAVAFTHAGGVTVEAGCVEEGDGWLLRVSVADTGVGVAEADRARIFERFVQTDDSLSRRSGGAGLGLAIARQLVELMGGTITLESVEGRGSVFRFTVRAGRAAAPPADEVGEGPARVPPLRILVAEDNATNQHLVRALLASGGHDVTVVANGREAVRAVREGAFDVVLMDVQMPEMDGYAAAREIRRLPGPAAAVPIVALTASVLSGDEGKHLEAGMTDYVGKPIDRAALFAALARAAGTLDEAPAEAGREARA